jgi:hypothetical protein
LKTWRSKETEYSRGPISDPRSINTARKEIGNAAQDFPIKE